VSDSSQTERSTVGDGQTVDVLLSVTERSLIAGERQSETQYAESAWRRGKCGHESVISKRQHVAGAIRRQQSPPVLSC
jgi:hypothetical protein